MSKTLQPLRKVFSVGLVNKDITDNKDGTITVRGKFTSDQKDVVGDIITRGATERAIPKYRQWGNIRYMHMPKPAGKVTGIGEDDGLEWNEVEIKVIDPQSVFEVKNGLLQALSIGALVNFEDVQMLEDGGWIINDYELAEISLVDHPANYDAKLNLSNMPDDFRQTAREQGLIPALKSFAASINVVRKDLEETTTDTASEAVEKSPGCRQQDESVDDCVARKIPEIMDENPDMDQEQAVAIAHSMCENACSEESIDNSEEDKNMPAELEEVIEEVADTLDVDASLDTVNEGTLPEVDEVILEEATSEVQMGITDNSEVLDTAEELEDAEMTAETVEVNRNVTDTIEETVTDESEEDAVTLKDLARLLTTLISQVKNLTTTEETEAEVPQAEEQTESDAVATGENTLEVAVLLERIEGLEATIAELQSPVNRNAAVLPETIEEEEEEVSEEVINREPEPSNLHEGLKAYFKTRNKYTG